MTIEREGRNRGLTIAAVIAILFGILTVVSGGTALFGGPERQDALGNVVPFVLWFNFAAGFAYVAAGAGLLIGKNWAVWLAAAIAVATIGVFAAFAVFVAQGGAYEMRTVGAMSFRTAVWLVITWMAVRGIGWR